MRSYNLFRLKGQEELLCAVPETRAVPSFVGGGRWSFGGRFQDQSSPPLGFDRKAAATAIRFNGYYLFQAIDRGKS